ncbi:2-C-methyl-D-erythritol 4-phosphate cytidylyltransferase [Heyndrickxia sporothermodurans]|uniref:2-C-methyl-D-erythritol 4-phosphate cytidylyltransferase n=1 Tax=Heyndrickxia TaxID=2837504 RepID=UPI000D34935F|nr:2-C-methyl-D-erythritol 4-phosphate cytidylyltransferase [Heyndrickxia sporothermodurans]PTY77727.1 2-C-methyl-D-erythritol 4-phosphate cytidylyltransferase [Heyndrickxia sporothermodurans]
MDYQVIIPAAGQGKRMGAGKNKLLLELQEQPVILHTLNVFLHDQNCKGIILVIQPDDELMFKELLNPMEEKIKTVYGGTERQFSVYNGLQAVKDTEIVLVHDGARPFIKLSIIHQLVNDAHMHGAAIAAVPVKDTIKKVTQNQVMETVERSSLWQVQTPQAFRFSILFHAHQQAHLEKFLGTDESSLVERLGYPVNIVTGDYDNIKLTTPEDLYFAEAILKKRSVMK